MPRICSFYNPPSSCWIGCFFWNNFYFSSLRCLMCGLYPLLIISYLFYFFGMICFVKTQILLHFLISVCCWWWCLSFDNHIINCINCNSNIMSICRCYNDRYNGIPSLSVRICLLVPPNLLSISRIMSSHRPPKGDFTDILLSRDCQFHFIPPPFFCYRIFLAIYSFFIKYSYLFPFLKSSMICWTRPIFFG